MSDRRNRLLKALVEATPDGIVDSHHHLWNLAEGRYPWLQEAYRPRNQLLGPYRPLCRDYQVHDLRHDQAPLRLAATVHVEAGREHDDQLGETRWLAQLHAAEALPTVAVGHVSFLQPDMHAVLLGHLAFPLMRGVRCNPTAARRPGQAVHHRPGALQDPRLLQGLAALQATGLSWDLATPAWHLAEAAEAIAPFPDLVVVINHCGLPLDRSETGLHTWRKGLEALAAHPNTYLKLSGFGLPKADFDPRHTTRLVRDSLAIFGPARVMYGSNLPVSSLAAPAPETIAAILEALTPLTQETLHQIFTTTARQAYRF